MDVVANVINIITNAGVSVALNAFLLWYIYKIQKEQINAMNGLSQNVAALCDKVANLCSLVVKNFKDGEE